MFRGCLLTNQYRELRNPKEELMSKTFRWLLPVVMAGLSMAVPSIFARGQGPSQAGPSGKKINGLHRQELQNQRRRLKQSGKSVHAEALQSGHHSSPPKAERHQMRKVQSKSKFQNSNLQSARKQNRSRRKVLHQAPKN
jgi:hypothetical protein